MRFVNIPTDGSQKTIDLDKVVGYSIKDLDSSALSPELLHAMSGALHRKARVTLRMNTGIEEIFFGSVPSAQQWCVEQFGSVAEIPGAVA